MSKSRPHTQVRPTPAVAEQLVRVRIRSLEIPPIKDGLVIGRSAAIGGEAITRTLRLMTSEKFTRIPLKDDVIEDVIIRDAVAKKIGQERLIRFVQERVKPIMAASELLLLDIDVELVIEDSL